MKKIIVSLFALATIIMSAQAQTRRNNSNLIQDSAKSENRKHHNKSDGKQLAEKLQLTVDQKRQLSALNTDVKNRMKELKSSNLSTEEYNRKKTELLNERKQKMTALLTPEQKIRLKQTKKEQHGNKKMDSAERMGKMKEKLDLSNDQVAKINAQKEEFKSKFEVIKNNQALSADEKRNQMKALKAEQKNSFRSILTPEQAKKIEEMKQKRTGKAA